MKVKKYNGKTQNFDKYKIEDAIKKAADAAHEHIKPFKLNRMASKIEDQLLKSEVKIISSDEISKMVEDELMSSQYKDTAWHYITYHHDRQQERLYNSEIMKQFQKKLNGLNIESSNANCDERSFSGRMNEAATILLKDNALHEMDKVARKNHENNMIYIHDLNSWSAGLHNCFDSFTEFITSDGIKQFRQFTDGEPVTVLDKDGKWRQATVKQYGHKKVQEITLEYHGSKKDTDLVKIKCTKDHRWILKDGSVTTNIQIGDCLYQQPEIENFNNVVIETKEDAEFWCLGFIIGDGCDHYEYTQVALCGDKIQYADNFKKAFYKVGELNKHNQIVCTKILSIQKQQFLTNKLWKMLNFRQKQMLFDGYIHADGNYNGKQVAKSCCTADERILEFIKDLSCICGYHIRRITPITHDTPYKKNAKLWNIDFITKQNHTGYWIVKDIVMGTHNNSNVWCVEEPETHSFTLAGGIVTGNCLSIPFDELMHKNLYTKQTGIRPPRSISTAMQLVAVIIQVQSLQQFGGVSATHLDWTLVPFVRYTFFKHLRDGHKYITKDTFRMPRDIENTSIDDYKDDPCYEYAYDLTVRDTKQGAEGLIHNLNSLQSRSGNQLN